MATYNWSTLANNTTITNFNASEDVLHFDNPNVSDPHDYISATDGGDGGDRMFYNVTNGYVVNVNLETGFATGGDGAGSVLRVFNIEGVTGTDNVDADGKGDVIIGNGADNVLDGMGGDDEIQG